MKKYRNEWKYYCSKKYLPIVEYKLSHILSLDSNSSTEGRYYIHNLYFDDYADSCAKATERGISERYKWRIRFYDNNPNYIKLERKEKNDGRCHKDSCILTKEEYMKILKKEVYDLIYDTDKKLLKLFIIDIITKGFVPRVIIDYERIAFVEPIANIRITLDTNISASYEFDKFLEQDYNSFHFINGTLMEVKFDDILPSYIRNIIESFDFDRISFSKYYNGRKKMKENLL